ncbi:MAG TPA: hypothetical protein DDW18_02880 [Firmicutes bacterium]|nr:hypothetical protein [Bacillota bacterium]
MNFSEKIKNLFKPMDLTKGNPLKSILIFMLPILLSLLFQQVYTISDAAIVGQNLSSSEVAGVNDVYGLFYIVIQFAFGCTAGFSVVTSNKAGAKDEKGMRKSFAVQIFLCILISLILTVIVLPLTENLLGIIGIKEDSSVYKYAYGYLFIIYAGLFTQIFYNLAVSVLRSIGDSLAPLMFLIGSTIINIILDVLFIVVFHFGVEGAAFATILSQFLAAFISFIYIYFRYPILRLRKEDLRFSLSDIWLHIKLGLPLAFQLSILAIGLIILQSAVIHFDLSGVENCQNGYGVAVKFNDLMMTPFNALGAAILSYQGQNFGAGDLKRIQRGFKNSMVLMLAFYLIFGGAAALLAINGTFASFFLSASSLNDRVRFYASTYIFIDSAFYFFLGSLFVFRNTLQGIGKSVFPLLSGFAELIARSLICTFIPRLIDPANPISDKAYIGLCFSDSFAWCLAALVMLYGIIHYVIKGKIMPEGKEID